MPRLFNDTSTATSAAGRKGRPSTGKATMDSMDMDFDSDALLSGDDEPTTPQRDNDKVLDDAPNSATIVKGVMETSILEKLCQSDQPSDRPTDSTASTASSSPPPPSTTYSSPPPPQASSSSAVRTPPPAPGSSKIVTKSPTTGPFDKAMKANQAAVSPVKKNDPWQEAMKKLKKAGWTYKNHGGGRLDVDYDYYLPGGVALTKGGKPKRDFLEGLDQVKLFAKKYFGWIDGLAEEEMEEDRLAYEERMREERMKKEKQVRRHDKSKSGQRGARSEAMRTNLQTALRRNALLRTSSLSLPAPFILTDAPLFTHMCGPLCSHICAVPAAHPRRRRRCRLRL